MNEEKKFSEDSFGEKLVRTKFNPSDDTIVAVIKQKTAELINICEEISRDNHLASRAAKLAITNFQQASFWAVNAATEG